MGLARLARGRMGRRCGRAACMFMANSRPSVCASWCGRPGLRRATGSSIWDRAPAALCCRWPLPCRVHDVSASKFQAADTKPPVRFGRKPWRRGWLGAANACSCTRICATPIYAGRRCCSPTPPAFPPACCGKLPKRSPTSVLASCLPACRSCRPESPDVSNRSANILAQPRGTAPTAFTYIAQCNVREASRYPAKSRFCPLAQGTKVFWFFSSEKNACLSSR